ncbi:glutamate receptor ionotropic, NMDA 3A [Aplysia californica]|uniref:Glutamate receptor ionotropic, NMDA 3A n=1 Tax=Aplysia californica TaxID=6500 RepID=A0ABM1A354_APLCA|nr:glutamate receptor ionotropic, NMDA 3A [Aplysia californica]
MYMSTIVEDFQTDMKYLGQLYTLHCCKGLAIELLDALSRDLNFRYVVYFQNETDFGTPEDGIWTGMVGDIISGTADIVAGAFSMTSERMNVIDFTEPFYQNEFAVVTGQDGNYVSMWAFSSPFSGQVWLCISLSSIVAGIATSFLEWHSPFGLNPKGRKRTKNYGLGSGLLMVVVLMTGHTINIKVNRHKS